ncbi:MAG: DF family (seleno)protein [Terriglobales bacterium]
MRIEVLYIAGCPFHRAAVRRVQDLLRETGVSGQIREVLVTSPAMAGAWRFPGSPTIRVNGGDVAGEDPQPPAFSCRLYSGSSEPGLPSREMIRRAILAAASGDAQ